MNKNLSFIVRNLFALLFSLFLFSLEAGPTQRYLETRPIEKIVKTLGPSYNEKIPLLLQIAKSEEEGTFFGYHGMSQNGRLFQDILRAVFEETLKLDLPENFYFLRTPDNTLSNWEDGANSLLDHFANITLPEPYTNFIIEELFAIIKIEQGVQLKLSDCTIEELDTIRNYFQDYLDYYVNHETLRMFKKYAMPQQFNFEEHAFNSTLNDFANTVAQIIKNCYPDKNRDLIYQSLVNKFSDSFEIDRVFLLRNLNLEDERPAHAIQEYFNPIDDTQQPLQSLLISMNVPLFGNYKDIGCFTPWIYFENESVLGGDKHLENILSDYFSQIGLDPTLVSVMWQEGQKILLEEGINQGCILQFYDVSLNNGSPALEFVDKYAYVSLRHGIPVPNLTPSKYILGEYILEKGSKDLELRLVMNNRSTLNPYSTLRMMRWDSLSPEKSNEILLKMKGHLKTCEKDDGKLNSYIDSLKDIWQITDLKCLEKLMEEVR